MTRQTFNAFTRTMRISTGPQVPETSDTSAARLHLDFAPLAAEMTDTNFGVETRLRPMRTIDAVAALQAIDPAGDNATQRRTLVFDVQQDDWHDGRLPMPIAMIADRLGIECEQKLTDDAIVLDDENLLQLVGSLTTTGLRLVRIIGPIEPGDLAAIKRAVDLGNSPLLAEVRADVAMMVTDDSFIVLHTRDADLSTAMIAANFQHYLAALLDEPASSIDSPRPWQIARLLAENGSLVVRPIETNVYDNSVDVGIKTDNPEVEGPAQRSLIYDRVSDSWHDER